MKTNNLKHSDNVLDSIQSLINPFLLLKLNVLKKNPYSHLNIGSIGKELTYSIWNNIICLMNYYKFNYEFVISFHEIFNDALIKCFNQKEVPFTIQNIIDTMWNNQYHCIEIIELINMIHYNYFKNNDLLNINDALILYMELIECPIFNKLLDLIYTYINKYKISNNIFILWKLKLYIHISDELLIVSHLLDKFIYDYYNIFVKLSSYVKSILQNNSKFLINLIQLKKYKNDFEAKKYHVSLAFYDIYPECRSLNRKDYYTAITVQYKFFRDIPFKLLLCSNSFKNMNKLSPETKYMVIRDLKLKLSKNIKQWCSKLSINKYLKSGDLSISYKFIYQNPIIYKLNDELVVNKNKYCVDCELYNQLSAEIIWYIHKMKLSYAQYINFKFQNNEKQTIDTKDIYNILCNKYYPFDLSEDLSIQNLFQLCHLNDILYITKVVTNIIYTSESCLALKNDFISLYKLCLYNDCYNINYIFRYNLLNYIEILSKYISTDYSFEYVINKLSIYQRCCNKNKIVHKLSEVANLYNNIPLLIFKFILNCKQKRTEHKFKYYIYTQICDKLNYEPNILLVIDKYIGNILPDINEYIYDMCDENSSHKMMNSYMFISDIYMKLWKEKIEN